MTAKDYLSQLSALDLKISQKLEESAALREMVKGRGVAYDTERVQTTPKNAQEEAIVRYIDLEWAIDDMVNQYVHTKDKIINQIQQMADSRYIQILHDHYVPDQNHEVKSLEQLAVSMHYNYTYICELHGWALKKFTEMFLKDPKQSEV